jgi:hypothetical protein
MGSPEFSHYRLTVSAGPAQAECLVDITYFGMDQEVIGTYEGLLMGFSATWKDVACEVRKGLRVHGLDADPVSHVSPMVDLS